MNLNGAIKGGIYPLLTHPASKFPEQLRTAPTRCFHYWQRLSKRRKNQTSVAVGGEGKRISARRKSQQQQQQQKNTNEVGEEVEGGGRNKEKRHK